MLKLAELLHGDEAPRAQGAALLSITGFDFIDRSSFDFRDLTKQKSVPIYVTGRVAASAVQQLV